LRGRHPTTGHPIFRWTCQAHRGAIPNRTVPPPPPAKPRTPWKPQVDAPVHPLPIPAPIKTKKHRGPTHTPLVNAPVSVPAVTVTTSSDGTWQLSRDDVTFLTQQQRRGTPAFEVGMSPHLSRPLPTSVVYRVWGLMNREELKLEDV